MFSVRLFLNFCFTVYYWHPFNVKDITMKPLKYFNSTCAFLVAVKLNFCVWNQWSLHCNWTPYTCTRSRSALSFWSCRPRHYRPSQMCVVSFYKVFFLERGNEGVDNTCLSPLPLLGINDHFPKKNLYFIWQVLSSISLTVSQGINANVSLFSGKVSQYLSSRISWKYWIKKKRNT